MTKEKALIILNECRLGGFARTLYTKDEYRTARDMAIRALEQELLPSAQPDPLVKESRTLVKDLVKESEDKDVRIVINISEESYKNIKEQVDKRDYPDMQIGRAIADGVLIPECHVAESEDKDE